MTKWDMENPVLANIKSRRSVRNFLDKEIPRDTIDKIVEAGAFAPSALNRQPWRFIVITDRAAISELSSIVRRRLSMLYRCLPVLRIFKPGFRDESFVNAVKKTAESSGDSVFYNAPMVVIIAGDTGYENTDVDCSLAAQNMMLAAHSLGIGSCFIGRGKAVPVSYMQRRFGLPAHYAFNVWVAFGYPEGREGGTAPPRKEGAKPVYVE